MTWVVPVALLFTTPVLLILLVFTLIKDKKNKQKIRNLTFSTLFSAGVFLFLSSKLIFKIIGALLILYGAFILYNSIQKFKSPQYNEKFDINGFLKLVIIPVGFILLFSSFDSIIKNQNNKVDKSILETKTSTSITSDSDKESRYKKAAELQRNAANENAKQQPSESSSSITESENLEIERINDDQLKVSLDKVIIEYGDFINNIEPFDNNWKHVKVQIIDDVKSLTREEKELLVETSVPDIKGPIMGYATNGDSDIRFTFTYNDGETMAESTMMDNSDIKVK